MAYAGTFAIEVNGEHGSVWVRSVLNSRRWHRRRYLHSLMSTISAAFKRRTTAQYRRPSTSTVLWTFSYSLCSFPYEYGVPYYRIFQWQY